VLERAKSALDALAFIGRSEYVKPGWVAGSARTAESRGETPVSQQETAARQNV
jgi:hypothetical protein